MNPVNCLKSFRTKLPTIALGALFAMLGFMYFVPKADAQVLEQVSYRFYVNENDETPSDPWPVGGGDLAENAPITEADSPPENGDVFRIRMTVTVTGSPVSEGDEFKLQAAYGDVCSTVFSYQWFDVGGVGSGEVVRGYDNATPVDGDVLTTLLISDSDVEGTYEEENTASIPVGGIAVGETMEFDWVVQNNGITAGNSLCFRMVYPSGEEFDTYTEYPQIQTSPFIVKSQNWRWYGDEENETPTEPLEAENVQPIGVRSTNIIKLRLTIKETNGTDSVGQKFAIQASTDPSFSTYSPVADIASCSKGATWCYADGVDSDEDPIQSFLLSDSGVKGTHNEQGFNVSTSTHPANAAVEYEFTLQGGSLVQPETIYYFRAFDIVHATSVQANTGESYPSLQTFAQILEFSVEGVSANTTIDSWTTDVTSTPTSLNFGSMIPGVPKTSALRLVTSADGLGYQALVRFSGDLQTGSGEVIPGVPYTNDLPGPWVFDYAEQTGAFGYHTTDDVLSQGSTRFQDDDTWAAFTETGEEFIYTGNPVLNDIHDLLVRLEVSPAQPAGSYATAIIFIVSPTY